MLHEAGLAPSRERARALILAGRVRADGQRVDKAGQLLPASARLEVDDDPVPYVSRGGLKLAHALDAFGLDVTGLRCLDVGASTGGFTDCLLQRGAAAVVAVDVGKGQLDWGLRHDERVTCLEGVNARYLTPEQVGEPPDLVTADVAFIGLSKVLPALARSAPSAELVVLVKPQFELERRDVGSGGVVRDPDAWRRALQLVADTAAELGLHAVAATASRFPGPAGNREFLVRLVRGVRRDDEGDLLDAAVTEARRLRGDALDPG